MIGTHSALDEVARELDELLRARYPLIALQTHEEERAKKALLALASSPAYDRQEVYTWSRTAGLWQIAGPGVGIDPRNARRTLGPREVTGYTDPLSLLDFIRDTHYPEEPPEGEADGAIYLLCDMAAHLSPGGMDDLLLTRALRELAFQIKTRSDVSVILLGPTMPEVASLEKEITTIALPLPSLSEVRLMVTGQLEDMARHEIPVVADAAARDQMASVLVGLTQVEIENALSRAAVRGRGIGPDALEVLLEEKKAVIARTGALEYREPKPESAHGGYAGIHTLLHQMAVTFSADAQAYGIEPARGLLVVGPPGTGKDLLMDTASSIFRLPLVKMDMGVVLGEGGGVVGQGEMSLKRNLGLLETVGGIAGLSEFEKGLGGGGELDGGTARRMLGQFLTWMQEQTRCFVFATANDVRALPPELLRQGRWSQVIWVDLPTEADRQAIFAVHLRARGRDPQGFDLEALAAASPHYSGAEIEASVKAALIAAYMDGKRPLQTEDIVTQLLAVKPLAVTRHEDLLQMRLWAREHLSAVDVDEAALAAPSAGAGARRLRIG